MSHARFFVVAMALAAPSGCALVGFDLSDYGGDVSPDGSSGDVVTQDGPSGSDGPNGTDGALPDGALPDGTLPDGALPDGALPDGAGDTGSDGPKDTGTDGGSEVGSDAPVDSPSPDTGTDTGTDSAPPPCTVMTTKRVFVSSATYAANGLSLTTADMHCNDLAVAQGIIEPSFKAWLSDDATSAASRITHSPTDTYVLMDQATVVACNWTELVSLPHRHAIDHTESGALAPASPTCGGTPGRAVFTGTNPDGSIAVGKTCGSWGSASGTTTMGYAQASDVAWTQGCASGSCGQTGAIYCIEQ
jgi:hypothetical protein